MKLSLLLSSLIGVLALHTSTAGTYCPPADAKCPVDCCPDSNGEISIGYHSDYILHGVRHLRDNVQMDVNYTFNCLPLPITIGAKQITGLSSSQAAGGNFDESDIYAEIALPGAFGFKTSVGYIHRFFPNVRTPGGAAQTGDSRGELWLLIERDLFCGVSAFYRRGYDKHQPSAMAPQTGNAVDSGAWIHTVGLTKSLCLTDTIGLDLCGGVTYTDNYWPSPITAPGGLDRQNSTGWNNYYLKATMPIVLNCNATLVPYVGYNGTPDSWMADGVDLLGGGGNSNDIFHGGVSLKVKF